MECLLLPHSPSSKQRLKESRYLWELHWNTQQNSRCQVHCKLSDITSSFPLLQSLETYRVSGYRVLMGNNQNGMLWRVKEGVISTKMCKAGPCPLTLVLALAAWMWSLRRTLPSLGPEPSPRNSYSPLGTSPNCLGAVRPPVFVPFTRMRHWSTLCKLNTNIRNKNLSLCSGVCLTSPHFFHL